MLLSICIQHHPSRLLPEALRRYEVVDDPEPDGKPSAIRTYLECLRTLPPATTHRIVLQDDVVLADDFDARAEAAIVERPADLLALFVPNRDLHGVFMRRAAKADERWCALPRSANWAPAVALSWPVGMAADFVEFADEHVARRRERGMGTVGDDPVIGAWKRKRGLTIWATVPCLVDHPDVGYSLVKRRTYKGQNRARRAAVFTG